MGRPTLFHVELKRRGWDSWEEFCIHFTAGGRALAELTGQRRLATASVGRTTFERWAQPTYCGRPRSEAAQILEHIFGHSTDELFSPARTPAELRQPTTEAAAVIDDRWPSTSRLIVPATGAAGMWELTGRDSLAGTAAAVQVMTAVHEEDGDEVRVLASDEGLKQFLRPAARRGFLLGVAEHAEDYGLYVLDAASARRAQAVATARSNPVSIPKAYLLDDLTYGILWSLTQLDDGLLADDQALDAESHNLDTYLALPRSAPNRQLLELTSAGSSWWGSAFCAHYIERELQSAGEIPAFWTREQRGAEAAPWVIFSHKIDYLRRMGRFVDGGQTTSRVFCVPEAAVARTERYERILLLLAIALMERHGIRVRLVTNPAYADMDGVAFIPGQKAVVANWVRTGEALWAASTTSSRGDLRSYRTAFGDAEEINILISPDPKGRLEELARYLDIDWGWITTRCREVAEHGVAGLVRTRSRLLTSDGLDDALSFLGTFAPRI
ncbi:hypothetical protein [Streptomyces albogriseolus]|uniref:hypothetical protein n=1 Tax=Streptomyces albogriseolus TaxID=1887 RepID=UPI00225611CA|nr:hypothetical protein [Streptomyces viridodiastaticus]MCX4624549.1 hypothetical protein [Streptomyces viridodiastaticus]